MPHGLPFVQCGALVSAGPRKQEPIKLFLASPVMPFACALHSVIFCC